MQTGVGHFHDALCRHGHDGFHAEARDVLRAGLTNAAWITADDTGARHQAKNGFCTLRFTPLPAPRLR